MMPCNNTSCRIRIQTSKAWPLGACFAPGNPLEVDRSLVYEKWLPNIFKGDMIDREYS